MSLCNSDFARSGSTVLAALVGICLLTAPRQARGQNLPPSESLLPIGIVGRLYQRGGPFDRGLVVDSIRRLAAWDQYLYVALIDGRLEHLVDVWNVQAPGAPRLVDTLDFGNIRENAFTFTPVALAAIRGTLIVEANASIYMYRHRPDGKLELLSRQALLTGQGAPLMGSLSLAGLYGSHQQQVVPNRFVGTVPNDQIHQEVFLNLTEPTSPFLIRARMPPSQVGILAAEGPLNAVFRGEPASLTFDASGGTASLVTYHQKLDQHLDKFWASKLGAVFRSGSFDSSLELLVRQAVQSLDLAMLKAAAIDLYAQHANLGNVDFAGQISRKHARDARLLDVLAVYEIKADDPLELALQKMIASGFNAQLETILAKHIYHPTVQAWLNQTLSAAQQDSAAQIESAITTAFNAEIDAQGIAHYLTQRVISPLMGDLPFMKLTLRDLINDLANSSASGAIDTTLTVTGAGAIDAVLDFVDAFVGLPACARFPRSTREVIELALLDHGAKLDWDGPAWFELLKFYRYVRGSDDYRGLLAEVDQQLRQLHTSLAHDLFRKFSGASLLAEGPSWNTSRWLEDYAATLPAREIVSVPVASTLLDILALHGVNRRLSVRAAFLRWNLYLDQPGQPRATVGDLLLALQLRGLDSLAVGGLFRHVQGNSEDLRLHLEHFLQRRLQATFGVNALDFKLSKALTPFLGGQLNLSVIGESVRALAASMLNDAFSRLGFGTYLTTASHAFDGDCIAQWLVALDAARVATLVIDDGLYATAASEALAGAYDLAVSYCVQLMIQPLGDLIEGDFSGQYASWTSQLEPTPYETFRVFTSSPTETHAIRHGWVWQDQLGFVVQTRAEADATQAKSVSMVLFKPKEPARTLVTLDLGQWSLLNYVHMAEGAVYLGGSYFVDATERIPTGTAMILDLTQDPVTVQRMKGDDFIDAALATRFISVNQAAHFAMSANTEILFLPNAIGRRTKPFASSPVEFVGPELTNGRRLHWRLRGIPGSVCRIDASTNLEDWSSVETLLNFDGLFQFTDPAVADFPRRFYRAVTK